MEEGRGLKFTNASRTLNVSLKSLRHAVAFKDLPVASERRARVRRRTGTRAGRRIVL